MDNLDNRILLALASDGVREWLERPADGKPSAAALSLRLGMVMGERVEPRRVSALLSNARIGADRRGGTYGYSPEAILKALEPAGYLAELVQLAQGGIVNAGDYEFGGVQDEAE